MTLPFDSRTALKNTLTCSIDGCGRPVQVQSRGWCDTHYSRWKRTGDVQADRPVIPLVRWASLEDRFWAKVNKTEGCWLWTGSVSRRTGAGGYGAFRVGDLMRAAHRVSYELTFGQIPEGLELDHLCHTWDRACVGGDSCPHRRCVNPAHLEPVTRGVNALRGVTARKTHCKHGHEFTPENTRVGPYGRRCLTCERAVGATRTTTASRKRKDVA